MIRILTLISILGSLASIIGVVLVLPRRTLPLPAPYHKFAIGSLAVAGFLSLYVILVPYSVFEQNLHEKLSYYDTLVERKGLVLIQRGEIRIHEGGPVEREFAVPFAEVPKVEVVNLSGVSENHIPSIQATQHKVKFVRSSYGGTLRIFGDRFRWIATGTPLEAVTEE